MVMDYRERRQVSKNRPRRQPAGIFFFSIFVAVIIAYTLGLMTGWLVFRPGKHGAADNTTVQNDVKGSGAEAPLPAKEQPAAENTGKVKEPMLTFYETLPKGNRELIGSGLNAAKPGEPQAAKPLPQQKPAAPVKETQAAENQAKAKEPGKTPEKTVEATGEKETAPKGATAKGGEGKGRFVVQIASYRQRKEAEELRDRLRSTGVPAYIVESSIPEKGTFYRVRAGRHLDQKGAQDLADKAGKGAMVIPE